MVKAEQEEPEVEQMWVLAVRIQVLAVRIQVLEDSKGLLEIRVGIPVETCRTLYELFSFWEMRCFLAWSVV